MKVYIMYQVSRYNGEIYILNVYTDKDAMLEATTVEEENIRKQGDVQYYIDYKEYEIKNGIGIEI